MTPEKDDRTERQSENNGVMNDIFVVNIPLCVQIFLTFKHTVSTGLLSKICCKKKEEHPVDYRHTAV